MQPAEYAHTDSLPEESVRILIVDDNEEQVLEIMHALEDEGYIFEKAFNESEALAKFHEFQPELALMGMNGNINAFETAKIFTNLSGDHFFPILFLCS